MGYRRLLWTLVAALLAAALVSAGSVASARSIKRDRGLLLQARFERVRGSYVVGGGRYVFIGRGSQSAGNGVLIDGRTRRSRALSRPGCRVSAVGAPWVAFSCGGSGNGPFQLYNIQTGSFQSLIGNAPYGYCTTNCIPITAIGADWVAFLAPAGDYHDRPVPVFQSLRNGQVLSDPANSLTGIDLDSPQLAQSICRPLSLPVVSDADSTGWGSLTFDDGFAIASGSSGDYLERCGSRLHEFLTYSGTASSAHEIIWQSASRRLAGIFLPDRQRFTVDVPAKVDPSGIAGTPAYSDRYGLTLTATRLYLINPDGLIWSSPAPTEPSRR